MKTRILTWGVYALAASGLAPHATAQQTVIYGGLQHDPIGSAQLEKDPAERLVVSNLGSSGCDGFRVDLGQSGGQRLSFDGDMPLTTDTNSVALTMVGTVQGVPDTAISVARVEGAAGASLLSVDFSAIGATRLSLELLDGSDRVLGVYLIENKAEIRLELPLDQKPWEEWAWIHWCPPGPPDIAYLSSEDEFDVLPFPGGPLVTGVSGFRLQPVDATVKPEAITGSEITAGGADLDSFAITSEALHHFGQLDTALGSAVFTPQGKKLKISNLGSSGCDGFRVDLPDVVYEAFEFDPQDPASLPPGAALDFESRGELGRTPDQVQQRVRVENFGTEFGASVDVSSLAPASVRVDVLLDGVLQQSATIAPPPTPGQVIVWYVADGCRVGNGSVTAQEVGADMLFANPTTITLPGTAPVTGNEVVIVYENPMVSAGPLSSMSMRATDIPTLTMLGQTAELSCPEPVIYCTAKVNSCGLSPKIGGYGTPSATASSGFFVTGNLVRAQKFGMLLYTNQGRANIPFQGGSLCVAPPFKRTNPTLSSGTAGQCDGMLSIDMNAFASGNLGGTPAAFLQIPGEQINTQWWGRDVPATGSTLSDALEYTVCL